MTPKHVRKLAYQCAVKFGKTVPANLIRDEEAGRDWFTSFLLRNKTLSIRQPEATSLSRAINFNRNNVELFFNNLVKILDENSFAPHKIYNVDKTGVITVLEPDKVVATKGQKQVGAITSAEWGALVIVCVAVNAARNSIPPLFIFPRKNFPRMNSDYIFYNFFITSVNKIPLYADQSHIFSLLQSTHMHVTTDPQVGANVTNVVFPIFIK